MPRVEQNAFNGGELAPPLCRRKNLSRSENGMKKIRNGFVHIEGSLSNRCGTEFINKTKENNCRLIPFSFNSSSYNNYVLEIGVSYIRFYQNGGIVVYPSDYEVEDLRNQIVEVQTNITAEALADLDYSQSGDELFITSLYCNPLKLVRHSHYNWTVENISAENEIVAPTGLTATWTGGNEAPTTYEYLVTAVKSETFSESERSEVVTVRGELESYWGVQEYVSLSWTAVDDACEYNVYRNVHGVFGWVGRTETNSFRDTKIEPDLTNSAPLNRNPFENNNYPARSCFYQQRSVFAKFTNALRRIVTSQTSADTDFKYSRPQIATDSFIINIKEGDVNAIEHIVPLKDLLILTENGVWKCNGADGVFSADPLPVVALQEKGVGASAVRPIVTKGKLVFAEKGGQAIRAIGYSLVSDNYDSQEISLWSKHLFEGDEVVAMAYAHVPFRLLYCVMASGNLNVICYDEKQEVSGCSRYTTDGKYKDVISIKEENRDVFYFLIEREINGENVVYIEREDNRTIKKVSDSVFLDCALRMNSDVEVTEISGLEHLEGKSVSVVADSGNCDYKYTVLNGKIYLWQSAKNIIVGLPYEFECETLYIEGQNTKGLMKTIHNVEVEVLNSREDFQIIGDDGRYEQSDRSIDSINDPDKLFSKLVPLRPTTDTNVDATVKLAQTRPLPLTITNIVTILSVQEEPTDVQAS